MTLPFKSFIETQFPVSKLSKESYKERKANYSQTLTRLGKWWGRKPLILVRAALLGLLMPASDDPRKDRDTFLKILTMDEQGLWQRKTRTIPLKEVYQRLEPWERGTWFSAKATDARPVLEDGIGSKERQELQRIVFSRLSYDEKLEYCNRPEQIEGPSEAAWAVINDHLGTTATSLPELVRQLGQRQFGRVPRVGDAFCGGGSVPFEAARLGCESYGSDLNPVAALLTWAALNIVGGGKEVAEEVLKAQEAIYDAVDRQVTEWGIEHNERGWRADAYLYCTEVTCPECGWKVPLAPSWVIGEKTRCVAKLRPEDASRRFEILIESGVSENEIRVAKRAGTVRGASLVCPHCSQSTPIAMIRGDRLGEDGAKSKLRLWENDDIAPRPTDVFQERLYCIRWVEAYVDQRGEVRSRRHYCAPDKNDLQREEKVLALLRERFAKWQTNGYIPNRQIAPGEKTDELVRTRGWTHWHHLFSPRQLLLHGLCSSIASSLRIPENDRAGLTGLMLWIGSLSNRDSKITSWVPSYGVETTDQVFNNQALNTKYNWASRGCLGYLSVFNPNASVVALAASHSVKPSDCRSNDIVCDYWITDPPYADAINYHELSEFFLAWYEHHIPRLFPDWYTDSKRALAITGADEDFRRSMVDCYRNLTKHMPDNGIQIVMFTHQDVAVWADLAIILWASGLRVTAAWCVATETDSPLKQGNYVQGTVLLVLRKQTSEETAFLDEVYPQVEQVVRTQLDAMLTLDDKEDPNFGDTDYQLAAYAAALRVLTRYRRIEDVDVDYELSKPRREGRKSPVEDVIENAVRIACDHLVPQGLHSFVWKTLAPDERFYLKGLDIESHGEYRSGAYHELARGFGVREYKPLLATGKANQTRLKTASAFGSKLLGTAGFGGTLTRHALFAIREVVRTGETETGRNWFRNELRETYWQQRRALIEILKYLSRFELSGSMPQWKEDGRAARLLSGAVENDHI